MNRHSRAFFVLACALCACSNPNHTMPPPARGLLHADATPPSGAMIFERPQWQVGDRFVFRSGGRLRVDFRVAEIGPERIVLEEAGGLRQIYTAELAAVGEEVPGEKPTLRETPDPQFLFPLWVGKRWTLEMLLGEMRIMVDYHCDVMETVRTPAGDLDCVRIWRTARLADSENPLERVTVLWYAPQVGFWAQKLEDGALLVLEEAHRQGEE